MKTLQDRLIKSLVGIFAAVAAVGGWLQAEGLIDAASAESLKESAANLIPAAASFVAIVFVGLIAKLLSKIFPQGSGENESGSGPGMVPLLLITCTMAALVGSLSSCTVGTDTSGRLHAQADPIAIGNVIDRIADYFRPDPQAPVIIDVEAVVIREK